MKKIDLNEEFTKNICSFEIAKEAKAAGMTSANTFYAYSPDGTIGDQGWIEKITGAEMYPCINLALAIGMIGDASIDPAAAYFYEGNDIYHFEYLGDEISEVKLVDLLVRIWIKYKNKK